MSNQRSARSIESVRAFTAGLAHLVHSKVIDRVRRGARLRAGAEELIRLDDRVLRDIGLTRSQLRAAAYGLIALGERSPARSTQARPSGPDDVRLEHRATALSVDGATVAPLAKRAGRG
jgi:uncharacterized protein YjiS (DUF1127 family)